MFFTTSHFSGQTNEELVRLFFKQHGFSNKEKGYQQFLYYTCSFKAFKSCVHIVTCTKDSVLK